MWADGISGFFLIILAVAVLFEFIQSEKRTEIVRRTSYIAVSVMGMFLFAEFFIGRNGFGWLNLGVTTDRISVVIGCIFVVMGVILNIVARIQLGKAWSNDIVIYKDQKLVDRGLYSIVRHPLYATIFMMALGLALQYQNYPTFILTIVVFLPLLHLRINGEEKVLRDNLFGYTEYAKKVPVMCPLSLNSFFSTRTVMVNSWALRACRATTVLLLLAALYFDIPWLVILTFVLMLSGTVCSISRSPVVILFNSFFTKLGMTKEESVDVNAIRFAQGLGSILLMCAILYLYVFGHLFGGWVFVSIVAMSTAVGSLGYCFGAYIYFSMRKIYHLHA